MHKFHYNYIQYKFDAKLLLFTDTDSLVYEIKTEDVYEDFYLDKDLFDLNDYPVKSSKFFDPKNKKVIDKMKEELIGEILDEFVGLKSKMHLFVTINDEEVRKAKGIDKKIKFKEFVDVLLGKKVIRHHMKRIQSKLHRVGTYDVYKISLSCFDDKRWCQYFGLFSQRHKKVMHMGKK